MSARQQFGLTRQDYPQAAVHRHYWHLYAAATEQRAAPASDGFAEYKDRGAHAISLGTKGNWPESSFQPDAERHNHERRRRGEERRINGLV